MRMNLIRTRMRKGLTQEALARMAGVGKSRISALENGRSDGSVKLWDRLEAVLGTPQQTLRRIRGAERSWESEDWHGPRIPR
jgi:transcriptional regulator with XRE-family HTH domain